MTKHFLSVRYNGTPVGVLEQTPTGKMKFTYDIHAKHSISLGMPIREEPYDEAHSEAYFGGLLPESEIAREIIGKRYGISHNNNFALLRAIGYDCAGAISCHALDDPIVLSSAMDLDRKIISESDLYKHIKELPKKPLFMDVDGLRLSLAGVQDKAAVCMIDNQIALAENGCPTTHILKPSSHYYEGMAENEYFCLRIAKRMGLPVPNIELRKIKDITFLLIERYDRRIRDGKVERIHQEDFCQAMGILSIKKYEKEGGPTFKSCFELLKNSSQPAIDRNLLAAILVFNYLISNMDAHGKNFSLLHNSPTNITLAPFYDLICTKAYPDLTSKMAMKISSQYDAEMVFPRHWEDLCKTISYRYFSMKELIISQAENILQIAREEFNELKSSGYDTLILEKIIKVIERNVNSTLKEFEVNK